MKSCDKYFNYIADEWWTKEGSTLDAKKLKIFIVKDLEKMGVDISKVSFFVEVYGIHKLNIRIFHKNEYTREILSEYTRKQLERKIKLDSLELED